MSAAEDDPPGAPAPAPRTAPASKPDPLLRRHPELRGSLLIVTYGRSGSTLLQSMLQTIPGAHIVGENYNALHPLFQSTRRAQRTKRVWGGREREPDSPWFGADKVAPRRYARRLFDAFVDEILQPPADVRWLGFKEIRHAALGEEFAPYMDFLREMFPNAFIVFNSREPGSVAKSGWWRKRPAEQVHEIVRAMDARFADYAAQHPDVTHLASYERTTADPATLGELFEKIGEPFDLAEIQARLGRRLTH